MAEKTDHQHEIEGEWFAHDHEGGDRPHRHVRTEDGACPVCGEVFRKRLLSLLLLSSFILVPLVMSRLSDRGQANG
jgi:hypothetical protein